MKLQNHSENLFNLENKKILLIDNGLLIRKNSLNFKIALESTVNFHIPIN